MNFYGYDASKAIANCGSGPHSQHQSTITTLGGWQKPGPGHVVELLEGAAFAARADARQLAGLLAQQPWRIVETARAGSARDQPDADGMQRLGLSVAGRTYQLHCKSTPALHVTRITG